MTLELLPELIAAACFSGSSSDPHLAVCESNGANAGDLVAAVQLALNDAGRRVVLALGDDQRDPAVARVLATRLAASGVRYVIGHFGSRTALAAADIYDRAGALFLAPGSSADDLCNVDERATTLQFFGTDAGQTETLVGGVRMINGSVLIVAEPRNHGAQLGASLMARLTADHRRIELRCGPAASINIRHAARQAEGIVVLGSREFAETICKLDVVRTGVAEVFLSDDSFAPTLLAPSMSLERCRIAFLAGNGDRLVDRPVTEVRMRAAALLGRPPGPYLETSYLAVRALASAWDRAGAESPSQVRRAMQCMSWETPFGHLHLSSEGRIQGYRWDLVPAAALLERAGIEGRPA